VDHLDPPRHAALVFLFSACWLAGLTYAVLARATMRDVVTGAVFVVVVFCWATALVLRSERRRAAQVRALRPERPTEKPQ
jgi:hypothetical protein